MEKFDIDKEMAKLKGLNIIEKCSALDDLLDDLEDAQEQIICAKDEISEEYATFKFYKTVIRHRIWKIWLQSSSNKE